MMNCSKCNTRLNTLEIREIYDGVCAWFCPECDYYELRTGPRFDLHLDQTRKTVKDIQLKLKDKK